MKQLSGLTIDAGRVVALPIILGIYYLAASAWGLSAIDWMLESQTLLVSLVGGYLLFSLLIGIWIVGRVPVERWTHETGTQPSGTNDKKRD